MILLKNLLIALAEVLNMIFSFFSFAFFLRAIISWVSPDPSNPIVQFLYSVTDPLVRPIRKFIPPLGMIDLSVFVAFIVLVFLQKFLVESLRDYALHLVTN